MRARSRWDDVHVVVLSRWDDVRVVVLSKL